MISVRICLTNLLVLCLIFSERHGGFCRDSVWQPPKPSIGHVQAITDKQTLVVSWLVNHSGLMGDIFEIQIGRTENHTVIYTKNMSSLSVDSDEYTWTWTSDLPLNCVDHSVRMRHFYNRSVPSPWSDWITKPGYQAVDKTKIFPHERVLREGSTAMFCCVPPRGVNITSITLNNSKHPLISIGARVKAIAVENLTIPEGLLKAVRLSCKDTTGNMVQNLNYVSFPPQKPRNLSCATSDLTAVTCTWDPGRSPHHRNNQTQTLLIENSDQAPIKCQKALCTFPAVPQLEEYNISVVVKDQLGEERESYSFNISDRVFPVAEWHRVSRGATDATVSWIIQGNLTRLNLLCQVTTDPSSLRNLSCNGVSGLCEVKLEHLLPNTRYSTRVRCSVSGRIWGEWTRPLPFTTCPLVTLDVWRVIKQLTNTTNRQVTLLWTKHIPGSAATVNIQGYRVQWSQEGQNGTTWKDSGQTQAEVSINPGRYDFTVQAVVHNGFSLPVRITIPQRDDGENLPVVIRLSSSTVGGFNLTWDKWDTATCGYTVEWCILGDAVPCTLRWMKVPQGNNSLSLPAINFKAGCRYTFKIYECTDNGHRLLETQTGYSQELKSVRRPSLVKPAQSTSSSVTLQWRYSEDDATHPAFITGYLITVEEVGSERAPFSVLVEDPQKKNVTIQGLQPNRTYSFTLSALTKEGPGAPDHIIVRTSGLQFTHRDSAHLAKVLTPSLLLLCCTVLLWLQRKMLRRVLWGIFVYPAGMNIKTPELDSFLREKFDHGKERKSPSVNNHGSPTDFQNTSAQQPASERLQSQRVEECSSCDIEILNTRPLLNEMTTLSDPEPPSTALSPGPLLSSPNIPLSSCVLLQADYCPQSVPVLSGGPALQQTYATNKTYFYTTTEDSSETQYASEVNEPSESLQDSCSVVYGYISNDTF